MTIANIEDDAIQAINAGREWFTGMLARLNDFKSALEKDVEEAEAGIKQAAAEAEATIAGKKDALAKVIAELEIYAGLVPAPAASAEPTAPAQTVEPAADTDAPAATVETATETTDTAASAEPAPGQP